MYILACVSLSCFLRRYAGGVGISRVQQASPAIWKTRFYGKNKLFLERYFYDFCRSRNPEREEALAVYGEQTSVTINVFVERRNARTQIFRRRSQISRTAPKMFNLTKKKTVLVSSVNILRRSGGAAPARDLFRYSFRVITVTQIKHEKTTCSRTIFERNALVMLY